MYKRQTDYTGIVYPGSSDIGIYTVNPYVVEDEYPAGREAISGSATSILGMILFRASCLNSFSMRNDNIFLS